MAETAERILTPAEERVCIRLAKEGNVAARNMLVAGHIRFVKAMAKKLAAGKASVRDCVSAGVLGLDAAIGKFDPTLGVSFLSFAVWYIRMAMQKEIRSFGTRSGVNLPSSFSGERIRKIGEAIAAGEKVPYADAAAYWAYSEPEYLDSPLPGSGDRDGTLTYGDVIADRRTRSDGCIDRDSLDKAVRSLRGKFTPTEREIFDRAVYTDLPDTHEEIGLGLGLSRERVRQIKNRLVRKIRSRGQGYEADCSALAEILAPC